jgi:hypothetical protein
MSGRAALNIEGLNQTYFFHGEQYIKAGWNPDSSEGQQILIGPVEYTSQWDSLRQASFKKIDAILPQPDGIAYFFCGNNYARVKYVPGQRGDYIIGKAESIQEGWPALKIAGFDVIDAALVAPGRDHQAYFFSGEKYCRVNYTPGAKDDKLVDGPHTIARAWHSLPFSTVDTVFPNPKNKQNAYLFKEGRFVELELNVGSRVDVIIIRETDASEKWPVLGEARFY